MSKLTIIKCAIDSFGYIDIDRKNLEDIEAEIREDERNNILDKVNVLIQTRLIDALTLGNATKYGNLSAEQQSNSYATVMKYEIADCVYDLIDDLEELKEQKNV